MLSYFLKFELTKILKYFRTKTLAKVITSTLFLAVFLFVGVGIYFFFVSGFRYINIEALADSKDAITLFLYEMFLLVLGGIVVFGALVSGVFNLFKGDSNGWVISSPGYKMYPRLILVRSLLSSSLPLVMLFLPAVVAFIRVYDLHVVSLVFILISVFLLLVTLNALTLSMLVLFGYIYYKISEKVRFIKISFKGFISSIVTALSLVIFFIWRSIHDIDLVKIFKADIDSDVIDISLIGEHFNLLPTHPFALEILHFQNGNMSSAFTYFLVLVVFALTSSVVYWYVSPTSYPLWQRFQEGASASSKTGTSRDFIYHFEGGKTLALFKKEALISSRNFKGILWFLFLFFIWLIQVGTNKVLGMNIHRYQTDITEKLANIQALQFIIAVYFICSFTLRFVFPSFSLEKKTGWILSTAPLNFKKIFFGKYLFFTSFFVSLGIVMGYINAFVLNASSYHAFYSLLLFIAVIIFTVTFGLSLGAIFPSFETDDPEAITTSMPGLFFTAASLIYGALSAWILYLVILKGNTALLLLFVVVTIILSIVMLLTTPKLVRERTF